LRATNRFAQEEGIMPPDSQPVKLLLSYDVSPDVQETYFQFILGEMVPTLQSMGVHMSGAWHTAYGDYPMRLVEFIAQDRATLEEALATPTWEKMEERLGEFVTNYSKKVVALREDHFQF
jgi:hypothetical protein